MNPTMILIGLLVLFALQSSSGGGSLMQTLLNLFKNFLLPKSGDDPAPAPSGILEWIKSLFGSQNMLVVLLLVGFLMMTQQGGCTLPDIIPDLPIPGPGPAPAPTPIPIPGPA